MEGETTERAERAGLAWIGTALVAMAAAGCGGGRPHSDLRMTDGTATYEVTDYGLSVAGSFTLVVGFLDQDLPRGDESDVYLHRLQLRDDYAYQVDESKPAIEEVTSDRPMPFVATVGNQTSATFHWSIDLASTLPSALCDARLVSQVYLSLTDELDEVVLDSHGHWQGDPQLLWSPDPCHP